MRQTFSGFATLRKFLLQCPTRSALQDMAWPWCSALTTIDRLTAVLANDLSAASRPQRPAETARPHRVTRGAERSA